MRQPVFVFCRERYMVSVHDPPGAVTFARDGSEGSPGSLHTINKVTCTEKEE